MYSLPSSMKIKPLLYIFILFLLLSSVMAEKITLKPGESYTDEDKNMTLLKLDKLKALVCVNNQKGIVAKGKRVDINGIIVEMINYNENDAKFDIEVPNCYKCECKEECLNLVCKDPEPIEPQQILNETNEPQQEVQTIEIVEEEPIPSASIIAVILIVFVCLLGIWVLWKRIH